MRNIAKERFEKVHSEDIGTGHKIEIIRDTHTGVCYLWRYGGRSGFAGGLTVLLGPDGGPVIQR